jgi:hypothetical protein
LKSIDTELTQYLWPVAVGPSLNKCPKWLPQLAQTISVRVIPCVLSKTYLTFPGIESSKEGQPQCASNFELLNNGSEQAPHNSAFFIVNCKFRCGRSVPFHARHGFFLRPALFH